MLAGACRAGGGHRTCARPIEDEARPSRRARAWHRAWDADRGVAMHRVDAELGEVGFERLDLVGDDDPLAGPCENADGSGTPGPVRRCRAAMDDRSRHSSELAKLRQELARNRCEAAATRE